MQQTAKIINKIIEINIKTKTRNPKSCNRHNQNGKERGHTQIKERWIMKETVIEKK